MGELTFTQLVPLLQGLLISLSLLLTVSLVGFCSGTMMSFCHLSRSRLLNLVAQVFDVLLRGTPPVVFLLVIFYGVTELVDMTAFTAAATALGLRAGGYFGRIFEGAVKAVPSNQRLAAKSIGLSPTRAFVFVTLPQAYRHALPGVANELSAQLKLTSLAFVVGVVELMRQARYLIAGGTGMMTVLLTTAAIYYLANLVVFLFFNFLERSGNSSSASPAKNGGVV